MVAYSTLKPSGRPEWVYSPGHICHWKDGHVHWCDRHPGSMMTFEACGPSFDRRKCWTPAWRGDFHYHVLCADCVIEFGPSNARVATVLLRTPNAL